MQTRNNWKVEKDKVLALSLEGKTLQEIGDLYKVSREQIRQVLVRYFPKLTASERGSRLLKQEQETRRLEKTWEKYGRPTWGHPDDLSRAMAQCFTRKKQNARGSKWEWTVTRDDVIFPLVCPILGTEINWFADFRDENSPSFDRIDHTKGYIPGNVIICSWRANRIKNNGTAEEHLKIAEFIKQHHLP